MSQQQEAARKLWSSPEAHRAASERARAQHAIGRAFTAPKGNRYRRGKQTQSVRYAEAALRRWQDPAYREKIVAALTKIRRPPREWPVIGVCVYCGDPANTQDHIVPTSLGGKNTPENKVPSCNSCNSSKGNLTVAEWKETPYYKRRCAA